MAYPLSRFTLNVQEMTSEVIIDAKPKEISIALLEDKRLVEYQNEQRSANFSVGNIYIAKVKKLMPGLNACFVDVGYERAGEVAVAATAAEDHPAAVARPGVVALDTW
jgi:Ribonuclease G/E